ncbi:MAG: hypothetical protein AABZ15_01580 [Nitrospirota bacterium]
MSSFMLPLHRRTEGRRAAQYIAVKTGLKSRHHDPLRKRSMDSCMSGGGGAMKVSDVPVTGWSRESDSA